VFASPPSLFPQDFPHNPQGFSDQNFLHVYAAEEMLGSLLLSYLDGPLYKPGKALPTFTFRQIGARSIEFQALPGPDARALRAKTMKHALFFGPGGQAVLSLRTGLFRCRAPGWAPDEPASFCGSTEGSPSGFLFPPMLFPRKALASGPQACFLAEKEIAKVKVGKSKTLLTMVSLRDTMQI
jgi:hypothetical protein